MPSLPLFVVGKLTAAALNAVVNAVNPMGLSLVSPTTIVVGSGSFTLSTLGKISVIGASTVSFNGCFTASYDNYLIVYDVAHSAAGTLSYRFRTAGTDSTSLFYSDQQIEGTGSAVGTGPNPGVGLGRVVVAAAIQSTGEMRVYAPALTTATRYRSDFAAGLTTTTFQGGLTFGNYSGATSFDGITFIPASGTITGTFRVYGYNNG